MRLILRFAIGMVLVVLVAGVIGLLFPPLGLLVFLVGGIACLGAVWLPPGKKAGGGDGKEPMADGQAAAAAPQTDGTETDAELNARGVVMAQSWVDKMESKDAEDAALMAAMKATPSPAYDLPAARARLQAGHPEYFVSGTPENRALLRLWEEHGECAAMQALEAVLVDEGKIDRCIAEGVAQGMNAAYPGLGVTAEDLQAFGTRRRAERDPLGRN